MESPPSSTTYRKLLDAQRKLQNSFPIIPTAYSLDGRRFTFHGPIGINFQSGRYVQIHRRDGSGLIGQILEIETEQLESSEFRTTKEVNLDVAIPHITHGEATIHLRRSGLRGEGVVLGPLYPSQKSADEPFDDAEIAEATADQVKAHFAV